MRWIFLCFLATLVATCGQKGPLVLPEEQSGRSASAVLNQAHPLEK